MKIKLLKFFFSLKRYAGSSLGELKMIWKEFHSLFFSVLKSLVCTLFDNREVSVSKVSGLNIADFYSPCQSYCPVVSPRINDLAEHKTDCRIYAKQIRNLELARLLIPKIFCETNEPLHALLRKFHILDSWCLSNSSKSLFFQLFPKTSLLKGGLFFSYLGV